MAAARQLEPEQSQRAANGLRNALTAICKAVANSPHAVLVVTTPEEGHDAYQAETQFVHETMSNLDAVTARVARDFTPTETADVPAILRRRLFRSAGTEEYRREVAQAYAAVWRRYNPNDSDAEERFLRLLPFSPGNAARHRRTTGEQQRLPKGARHPPGDVGSHTSPRIRNRRTPYPPVPPGCQRPRRMGRTGEPDRALRALHSAIAADVTGVNATAQRYGLSDPQGR